MATEVKMPQLGLTMEEGIVDQWMKQEGDTVKAGEPLFEVTTDKLTSEVEAEIDGTLLKIIVEPGTEVPVQTVLAYIGKAGEEIPDTSGNMNEQPEEKKTEVLTAVEKESGKKEERKIKISPLARKIAKENGVDYSELTGSGPNGRIVKNDILEVMNTSKQIKKSMVSETAEDASMPVKNLELMDGDVAEKMSAMRAVVARRMYASSTEIPTVTQIVKVDMTALMEFRKALNERREKRLSVNDFVLKAVAKALRKNPGILVSLDGDQIIRRAHVNLGMAVALEDGLIVPVIRDADILGLDELSDRAKNLADRARAGRLNPDEYKGSTFTVSNLGMMGVESFTPIINQPDAGILGVNCIENELTLGEDGAVAVHKVMRIAFTFDHRLIDGAVAAKFETDVRDLLQTPLDILL